MKLYIAEKPDVARAIVSVLGGKKTGNYYQCGEDIVVNCFGHMLELLDPEDYNPALKKWDFDQLPISNIPWKKRIVADKEQQVMMIGDFLRQAVEIIHAGDPDDEGQLIVDELLKFFKCTKPVKRVFINDNNEKMVARALKNAQDNSQHESTGRAAEARGVADQLFGYNMTRAVTLAAQQVGYQGTLSIGRVQTPALGLIVRRDRDNANHQASFTYPVKANFNVNDISFTALYQVTEDDPINEKKQIIDKNFAEILAAKISGKTAVIEKCITTPKETAPILPYSLLELQADCARKFGYKPDEVKNITQTLREKHHLITYNRTDCQYLNDEHHNDAPEVLTAIASNYSKFSSIIEKSDTQLKSPAFNDAKVTAHHAIIPTIAQVNIEKTLNEREKNIYLLIVRAYIAQFWPNKKFNSTSLTIKVEGALFCCTSIQITDPGWTKLYENDKENPFIEEEGGESFSIQALSTGDEGICLNATAEAVKSKPPQLYTMSSLLSDFRQVAKYVENPKIKKLLIEKDKGKDAKEKGGIGTPATRDEIIKTLFARGYITEKGKHIISTKTGQELYDNLSEAIKYPDMTALWYEQQLEIINNKMTPEEFIQDLMHFVESEVNMIKKEGLKNITRNTIPCPNCGKSLRRAKGTYGYFWGCTGFKEGCSISFPDKGGMPDMEPKQKPKISTDFVCHLCGSGLIRRPSKKKKGIFFWTCSGFPKCKQTYADDKGKPFYPENEIKEKRDE